MLHTVKDPVCGMEIKGKDVQNRSQHGDTTYYFCSDMCKDQFDKNPERFAKKAA